MHRSILLSLPITLGLTACAGAGASRPVAPGLAATVPATESTTTPRASIAGTTVSDVSTAGAAATTTTATAALTTEVPTTAAPTTTTVSLRIEIEAALDDMYVAIAACLSEPQTCETTTFAPHDSDFGKTWKAQVDKMVAQQEYVVPQPVSGWTLEDVATVGDGIAAATVCLVDGDWLMRANDSPDRADDAVINDLVMPQRIEYILRDSPNGFEPLSAALIDQFDQGSTSCGGL